MGLPGVDDFEGLTDEQREAVRLFIERKKTRYFSGIAVDELIAIFRRINAARARGAEDAREREDRFFEICGYRRAPQE